MYNDVGTERLDEYVPMDAITNVTKFLNVLEIVDPDILETSGCVMNVEAGTRSGGRMFFNASKAPLLKYLPNIYGTLLAVEGSIQDINIFMRNIEYTSDVQFNGIEAIVFDVSDNGCTGINRDPTGLGLETFILEVNVVRPKTCQFETCEECVSQVDPSLRPASTPPFDLPDTVAVVSGPDVASGVARAWKSAAGVRPRARAEASAGMRCRWAGRRATAAATRYVPKRGAAWAGTCASRVQVASALSHPPRSPALTSMVADRSWIIGAIGSPILLILLVGFYLLFMWARREHGTIPLWFNKVPPPSACASPLCDCVMSGADPACAASRRSDTRSERSTAFPSLPRQYSRDWLRCAMPGPDLGCAARRRGQSMGSWPSWPVPTFCLGCFQVMHSADPTSILPLQCPDLTGVGCGQASLRVFWHRLDRHTPSVSDLPACA